MAGTSLETLMRETRREVWRAYYADGLFDLAVGLGLLAVSWLALGGQIVFWYLPVVLVVTGLPAAKKYWVQPRTGYVKPGRPTRQHGGLICGVAALLLAMVLALVLSRRHEQLQPAVGGVDWVVAHSGLLLGLFGGGALLWNGYTLGISRLAGYGAGLALAGVLSAWGGAVEPIQRRLPATGLGGAAFFGLLGVAMVATGAVILGRYLRRHPCRQEAQHDV